MIIKYLDDLLYKVIKGISDRYYVGYSPFIRTIGVKTKRLCLVIRYDREGLHLVATDFVRVNNTTSLASFLVTCNEYTDVVINKLKESGNINLARYIDRNRNKFKVNYMARVLKLRDEILGELKPVWYKYQSLLVKPYDTIMLELKHNYTRIPSARIMLHYRKRVSYLKITTKEITVNVKGKLLSNDSISYMIKGKRLEAVNIPNLMALVTIPLNLFSFVYGIYDIAHKISLEMSEVIYGAI